MMWKHSVIIHFNSWKLALPTTLQTALYIVSVPFLYTFFYCCCCQSLYPYTAHICCVYQAHTWACSPTSEEHQAAERDDCTRWLYFCKLFLRTVNWKTWASGWAALLWLMALLCEALHGANNHSSKDEGCKCCGMHCRSSRTATALRVFSNLESGSFDLNQSKK